MMPLKNQVCTVEQAEKFDEMGVTAESHFVWAHGWPKNKPARIGWRLIARGEMSTYSITNQVNAYSCAELGVMLPADIGGGPELQIYKNQAGTHRNRVEFRAGYGELCGSVKAHEAHAKADLLIRILEEKIIKSEDVNYDGKDQFF